jgi:hypothetical protein
MTVATQVSVYAQVFVPRDYEVFAGLASVTTEA